MNYENLNPEKCIVCRWNGATLFEDGWFHAPTFERPDRLCRDRYLIAKREIDLRKSYAWDSIKAVGYGWRGILTNLVLVLLKTDPEFTVTQIKEKFGGLRFYTASVGDVGEEIIAWAETRSVVTCEGCGGFGKPREGGWIKTLCDDCNALREKGERPWLDPTPF